MRLWKHGRSTCFNRIVIKIRAHLKRHNRVYTISSKHLSTNESACSISVILWRIVTHLSCSVNAIFIADQNRWLVTLHSNRDLSGSLEQLADLTKPIRILQWRKPFTVITRRETIVQITQKEKKTLLNSFRSYFLLDRTACSLYALCFTALKSGIPSPYTNLVLW